jgi:hypothetical protein
MGLGGHNILQYIPPEWYTTSSSTATSTSFTSSMVLPMQKIIAGSSSGHLRLWSFPHKKEKCEWEVKSDNIAIKQSANAVIDIVLLPTRGHILSINQNGIISEFNVMELGKVSFAVVCTPKCLRRMNMWDSNPIHTSISGVANTINGSISVLPFITGVHYNMKKNPHLIYISLEDGVTIVFDLFEEKYRTNDIEMVVKSRKRNVSKKYTVQYFRAIK